MKIDLKLYASLSCHLPDGAEGNSCVMEIREGTTVGRLLEYLNIPSDAIKIMFLNGIHATGDEILKEGDRLGVFPPVAGG